MDAKLHWPNPPDSVLQNQSFYHLKTLHFITSWQKGQKKSYCSNYHQLRFGWNQLLIHRFRKNENIARGKRSNTKSVCRATKFLTGMRSGAQIHSFTVIRTRLWSALGEFSHSDVLMGLLQSLETTDDSGVLLEVNTDANLYFFILWS